MASCKRACRIVKAVNRICGPEIQTSQQSMIMPALAYQEAYQGINNYIFIIFNRLKTLAFSGKIE